MDHTYEISSTTTAQLRTRIVSFTSLNTTLARVSAFLDQTLTCTHIIQSTFGHSLCMKNLQKTSSFDDGILHEFVAGFSSISATLKIPVMKVLELSIATMINRSITSTGFPRRIIKNRWESMKLRLWAKFVETLLNRESESEARPKLRTKPFENFSETLAGAPKGYFFKRPSMFLTNQRSWWNVQSAFVQWDSEWLALIEEMDSTTTCWVWSVMSTFTIKKMFSRWSHLCL